MFVMVRGVGGNSDGAAKAERSQMFIGGWQRLRGRDDESGKERKRGQQH